MTTASTLNIATIARMSQIMNLIVNVHNTYNTLVEREIEHDAIDYSINPSAWCKAYDTYNDAVKKFRHAVNTFAKFYGVELKRNYKKVARGAFYYEFIEAYNELVNEYASNHLEYDELHIIEGIEKSLGQSVRLPRW